MLSVVEHIGTIHTLKGDITAFLELRVCSGKRGGGVEFRPKYLVLYKKQFNISNCSVVLNFFCASHVMCSSSSLRHVPVHFPDRSQSLSVTRWFVSKTRSLNLVAGCNVLRFLIKFEIDFETPH